MADSWIVVGADLHLSGVEIRPTPTTLVVGATNAWVDGIERNTAAAVDRIGRNDLMVFQGNSIPVGNVCLVTFPFFSHDPYM